MKTTRRILISGASGFTGRHACAQFAAQGWEVVAVVRRAGTGVALPVLPSGGSVRERVTDLSSPDDVLELVRAEQPDRLLHLAGLNAVPDSWAHPIAYMQVNVMSTLLLLDALRQTGLNGCRVLIAGSMLGCRLRDDEAPKPPHPYGLSKTLQTMTGRAFGALFGLPVLVAQPSNLIGPGPSNGLCGLIGAYVARTERGANPPVFRLSSTGETRDFLDVRDAVRAYAVILERGDAGAVYPIGSGRLRTLGETAAVFDRLAHVPVTWRVGAEDGPAVRLPAPDAAPAGPVEASAVDMEPMRRLGWGPEIPFERSIVDVLAYFRKQGT